MQNNHLRYPCGLHPRTVAPRTQVDEVHADVAVSGRPPPTAPAAPAPVLRACRSSMEIELRPRGAPSPGPSPLVPRGEGRIRSRCDTHRAAPAGVPHPPAPPPSFLGERGEFDRAPKAFPPRHP